MNQGYREPVWTDLADKDFAEWLEHIEQLQPKMDRWLKRLKINHAMPHGTLILAMYGEIMNLSMEAKERLKRERLA